MLKHYTKEEKSWIFYDWANSAFSAIVAAIILPVFFKSMAESGGVSAVDATAYWGYATSLGTLVCALGRGPFIAFFSKTIAEPLCRDGHSTEG